jgi:hypothetical protein
MGLGARLGSNYQPVRVAREGGIMSLADGGPTVPSANQAMNVAPADLQAQPTQQFSPQVQNLMSQYGLTPQDVGSVLGQSNMQQPTGLRVAHMASGGISDLGSYSDGGRLLKGPGDGMSDNIPAMIGGKQEARLADGEFVVPADVVSHLGNGSTDAGAKHLYKMMDNVRKARTGRTKQGTQIKANKYLPA